MSTTVMPPNQIENFARVLSFKKVKIPGPGTSFLLWQSSDLGAARGSSLLAAESAGPA